MAYPTVSGPYGFQPINLIGGQVFAGATRQITIANTTGTGYATSIFYGDAVKIASTGTIQIDSGTSTATPVGVFMGCQYISATTGQLTFSQYYPASLAVKRAVDPSCAAQHTFRSCCKSLGKESVARPVQR